MSEPVFEMFWKADLDRGVHEPAAFMDLHDAALQVSFSNKITNAAAVDLLMSGAMVTTGARVFRKQV
jgi:hypothetical protein